MARPLTKKQRGLILLAMFGLVLVGFTGWRLRSAASLDQRVHRVVTEAGEQFQGFDVRAAHLTSVAAQVQQAPLGDSTAGLPVLEGAQLYQAEYAADGSNVRITYWIDAGWAGERCVFVDAHDGNEPIVTVAGCPTSVER